MNVLGVSCFFHNSASCIIKNGNLDSAIQEERITRIKNDNNFPIQSILYCLAISRLDINDIDIIVFYEKPFIKFERIIENYLTVSPLGFKSFKESIKEWPSKKLFIKYFIRKELRKIGLKNNIKICFSEHHLSHAAASFYLSGFKDSAIISFDSIGEKKSLQIFNVNDYKITSLKTLEYPNSLGFLYSSFTYYLGFKVNSGEYKLMGLAPYGIHDDKLINNIKSEIVQINNDGSIILNQRYFNYMTDFRMANDSAWSLLFGFEKRNENDEITQEHCNLAYAIQCILEEIIIKIAKHTQKITNQKNLCLSGGVALNCVANGKLVKENIFEDVFVGPYPDDAGASVGAALLAYHLKTDKLPNITNHIYLGKEYNEDDIRSVLDNNNLLYRKASSDNELIDLTTNYIISGKILGWFQGRDEFGPRALGNRSIIADPRQKNIQKKINKKIKYRESFRPFAPSILDEHTSKYFELIKTSNYMEFVSRINPEFLNIIPDEFENFTINEKLDFEKSFFPGITHVDYTSRIQTVSQNQNSLYWMMINEFYLKTGCPMILNTSFNLKDEPIVSSPQDAINCFNNCGLDVLVLGKYIIEKM
jgi:carbamoyltransferase